MVLPNTLPAPPDVSRPPRTGAEIAAEIRRVHAASVSYWSSYSTSEFFRRPEPSVWAPVDQVRHLTTALRAMERGLRVPRLILGLLFRRPRGPSRPFTALAADYRAALAAGARAAPAFVPEAVPPGAATETTRARIMSDHAAAIEALATTLERWPEAALDRYRLPHPVLGRLTAREVGFFALYHNVHHVHVADHRRRAGK